MKITIQNIYKEILNPVFNLLVESDSARVMEYILGPNVFEFGSAEKYFVVDLKHQIRVLKEFTEGLFTGSFTTNFSGCLARYKWLCGRRNGEFNDYWGSVENLSDSVVKQIHSHIKEKREKTKDCKVVEELRNNIRRCEWDVPQGDKIENIKKIKESNDSKEEAVIKDIVYLILFAIHSASVSGKLTEKTNTIIDEVKSSFLICVSTWYEKPLILPEETGKAAEDAPAQTSQEERSSVFATDERCAPPTMTFPTAHFEDNKLSGSPHFVGRTSLINEILQKIAPEPHGDNHMSVYLWGVGGMGKTEIIRKVVQTLLNQPSNDTGITDIIWIDLYDGKESAEGDKGDKGSVSREFISQGEEIKQKICMDLHMGENQTDLRQEYAACAQRMRELGKKLLIVIDNIEAYSDDIHTFCFSFPQVRFLIAGRPETMNLPDETFFSMELKPLENNECKTLFKKWYNNNKELREGDETALEEIIALTDGHTVTLELFAKLIRKQSFYDAKKENLSPIQIFLKTLKEKGFDLRFSDGEGQECNDEPVTAEHQSMKREQRTIEQLASLFSTMKVDKNDKELLIKISIVPNLPFGFTEARKWFSVRQQSPLDALANAGWLQRTEGDIKTYSIHSVIAAAIRHENAKILLKSCGGLIKSITRSLITTHPDDTFSNMKLLIQFCWSIMDVFKDNFTKKEVKFLNALIAKFQQIGLLDMADNLRRKRDAINGINVDNRRDSYVDIL